MGNRDCGKLCFRDDNGNCSILGSDNLLVQCVGSWVENKYYFLEKYLNASNGARKRFADNDNAVFIDLYSGPGKCVLRDTNDEVFGGGLRAALIDKAPFNELHFFDRYKGNIQALEKRIKNIPNCFTGIGDSNILVDELIKKLQQKPYRYHFAFVDPFGPEGLKFNTLRNLAQLDRMDMLIHFPIGAIKRNLPHWLRNNNTILDDFLGTDVWRNTLDSNTAPVKVYKTLIEIYKDQLKSIGYSDDGLHLAASQSVYTGLPTVSVRNTQNTPLYVLLLISKHPMGQKIWSSIIKIGPDGQKDLFS